MPTVVRGPKHTLTNVPVVWGFSPNSHEPPHQPFRCTTADTRTRTVLRSLASNIASPLSPSTVDHGATSPAPFATAAGGSILFAEDGAVAWADGVDDADEAIFNLCWAAAAAAAAATAWRGDDDFVYWENRDGYG